MTNQESLAISPETDVQNETNEQDPQKGKLSLGPGDVKQITPAARETLDESDVIIGYGLYLRQIKNLVDQTRVQEFPMGKEQERALEAKRLALEGMKVAVVTGGDAGIYDMAAPVFELIAEIDAEDRSLINVEVIPGVTAANIAASMLGSPLAQDYAVISLSDRFVPWGQIERRLNAVAGADMVIALYEPSSKHRAGQLGKAQEVLLRHLDSATPVDVAREVTRADESVNVTTLAQMTEFDHDKRTVIIVGNSKTKSVGDWMITPRAY